MSPMDLPPSEKPLRRSRVNIEKKNVKKQRKNLNDKYENINILKISN